MFPSTSIALSAPSEALQMSMPTGLLPSEHSRDLGRVSSSFSAGANNSSLACEKGHRGAES